VNLRDPKLWRAAKNSPWILIAIGLHVILAAGLSVVVIQHGRRATIASATTIAVTASRAAASEPRAPEPSLDRTKVPERERMELVSFEEELDFVPMEEPREIDWHADLGDPTGSEGDDGSSSGRTSIGVGTGGRPGTGVPAGILRLRPGAGRGGGKPGRSSPRQPAGTEKAVLEGLRWLMRHQNEDGSWSAAGLHTRCSSPTPCIAADPALDTSYDVGMTALALLAFLGQGISVGSRLELVDPALGRPPRPAGEIVKRGIRWLIEHQKSDGSFSDSEPFALPENDTLPAMVLCEAYALARGNTSLRRPAQRALDFLVAAQRRAADGTLSGWGRGSQRELEARHARGELADADYEEARASVDLSISCWVVMALKSAQTCGFRVPDEVFAGALAYAAPASEVGAPAAGDPLLDPADAFTYHPAREAALGMLIRAFAGGDVADPFLESAARELAADPPRVTQDKSSVDFYYWYFATLALEQYDGPESPRERRGAYWEHWNTSLVAALLPLQERGKKRDACARGGWLQEARGNRRGRALYNTALNVLTLEVYYRFENVFGLAERSASRRGM